MIFLAPFLFFSRTVATNVNASAIGHLSSDVECLVKLVRSRQVGFKRFIVVIKKDCANLQLAELLGDFKEVIVLRGAWFEELFAGLARIPIIGFNADQFMAIDGRPAKVYQIHENHPKSIFNSMPEIEVTDLFESHPSLGILKERSFYCFHSRSSSFDEAFNNPNRFCHKNRNTEFLDYKSLIMQLENMGLVSVRLSEASSTRLGGSIDDLDNFLDVCELGLTDPEVKRLHLWLVVNCEGFVGCSSGLTQLANLFSKPVLIVNGYPASFSLPHKVNGLGLPKKVIKVFGEGHIELSVGELLSDHYSWLRNDADLESGSLVLMKQPDEIVLQAFQEFLRRKTLSDWTFCEAQRCLGIRGKSSYCLFAQSGFAQAYLDSFPKNPSNSVSEETSVKTC